MLIHVFDWIKNLTSLVNNTNYTYIDDEDLTYIVPPKNGNIIIFADQPFEYISNTTTEASLAEDKVAQFVILSGIIGVLFCTCGYLCYRISKPVHYQSIELPSYNQHDFYSSNSRAETTTPIESPVPYQPPPGYKFEDV